ncbi:hypothetical protein MNEG_11346 [Monoraphidium neglectum]|uniref:Protein kinase domain-containing protein n=1 Tax=Monoraphidium neglectum TaxID=145388 RepID=A0A0D2KLL3_9CHLO|nr:hypothetical protein MNEG_11346 [Monoraphidium neglectum]KIY96618.1 hypothetical protein MNEG_11346 [Monoraphidium neglectum]|eukprot:XP_013895638.1 hypothetical protein MNEG_11346 [Monoraphidium neglectum]
MFTRGLVRIEKPVFRGCEHVIVKHVMMTNPRDTRWRQALNEALVAPMLAGHNTLVPAIAWSHTNSGIALASFRPGDDSVRTCFCKLEDACEAAGLSPEETMAARVHQAGAMVPNMLKALHDLHSSGFIHRDGKADNWVVDAANPLRPLLIDFGLAQRISDGLGATNGYTPTHAPPEHLAALDAAGLLEWRFDRELKRGKTRERGVLPVGGMTELLHKALGPATDIYLLGATLWEVLFPGTMPYIGDLSRHTGERSVLDAILETPGLRFPPGPQPPESVKVRFAP